MPTQSDGPVTVPLGYPTALIFLDESGSRASANRFFVMAAVKLRRPGQLARAIHVVRDRNQFRGEFKFSEVTKGTLSAYYDLIDQIEQSDAHIAACVVNRDRYDPFPRRPPWEAHLEVASQLLRGCLNRRELASLIMDGISTPEGIALDEMVRADVNRRLRSTSLVTAACLDSRSCDGLQVADLVAGAVAFDRRQQARVAGRDPSYSSLKGKVAMRLMAAFGLTDFRDARSNRINIATLRAPRSTRQSLSVVATPFEDAAEGA